MAALKALIARLRRSESGAEFVEFALAFPLLLLVVMGIMDFGLMFQQYEVITNAAREGARLGSITGYSLTDAQQRAQQYITMVAGPSGAVVQAPVYQTIPLAGGGNACGVRVTVTYAHNYLFLSGIMGYFGGSLGTKTLSASALMRREGSAAACP
jgi:Flp pilus assembly protein TadG